MTSTSPDYSVTLRVEMPPSVGATSQLTAAVAGAGGSLTAPAKPDPEVDPIQAGLHAAIVATGGSDFPNQVAAAVQEATGLASPRR